MNLLHLVAFALATAFSATALPAAYENLESGISERQIICNREAK